MCVCVCVCVHMFTGIVDSATVSDRATSGKSFVLRDETGSITCVFCEIVRASYTPTHTHIYIYTFFVFPHLSVLFLSLWFFSHHHHHLSLSGCGCHYPRCLLLLFLCLLCCFFLLFCLLVCFVFTMKMTQQNKQAGM